jgi:hypothetical protein
MHADKKNGSNHAPQRHQRKDDGNAFIRDPGSGPAHTRDGLAEELAEEFIAGATSGEGQAEDAMNAFVEEELGGPFIQTAAGTEIAADDDPDLEGAPREAEPTAMRVPRD